MTLPASALAALTLSASASDMSAPLPNMDGPSSSLETLSKFSISNSEPFIANLPSIADVMRLAGHS